MQRFAVLPFVLSLVLAAPAASSAELLCGGTYHIRLNNNTSELETTHYRFKNFNARRTLTITGITMYKHDGTAVSFDPSLIQSPLFNAVLGPHQSAGINLEDILGDPPENSAYGNMQIIVTWEADRGRGVLVPLQMNKGRITKGWDNASKSPLETRARGSVRCESPTTND